MILFRLLRQHHKEIPCKICRNSIFGGKKEFFVFMRKKTTYLERFGRLNFSQQSSLRLQHSSVFSLSFKRPCRPTFFQAAWTQGRLGVGLRPPRPTAHCTRLFWSPPGLAFACDEYRVPHKVHQLLRALKGRTDVLQIQCFQRQSCLAILHAESFWVQGLRTSDSQRRKAGSTQTSRLFVVFLIIERKVLNGD